MLPSISGRTFSPFYMPGFFEDDFFPVFSSKTDSMPAVNIREDERQYLLDLAVPGIDKKEIKIDMNEDVLTISSETKNESAENRDGYRRKEFNYASFSRSFQIPDNVNKEKIEASYKDGVLIVSLPKHSEEKNKITRQIKIS